MGRLPGEFASILRVLQSVRPWSMTQVFMLGVLVSLVKLAHLAHVVPGVALWSFGGLILLLTASVSLFNMHESVEPGEGGRVNDSAVTASQMGSVPAMGVEACPS